MLKKVLAITLAVIMIICVLSVTAFAEGEGGEPETPVTEIYTIEDLYMINYDLGGNFKLMNDIDMTEATAEGGDWDYNGRGWEPIGSNGIYSGNTPFTGTFDGDGHEIIGMRIAIEFYGLPSGAAAPYVGLFGKNNGTIKNLTISGIISEGSNYAGYVGGVSGYNSGTIENCSNHVTITAQFSQSAGGITGYADENSRIIRCDNDSEIKNSDGPESVYSGGIAGCSLGTISKCYNNGDIECISRGKWKSGADAKYYYSTAFSSGITSSGSIMNCYNTGAVKAGTTSEYSGYAYAGGISASGGTISNCYNTGTTWRAIAYETVTNCYFLSGSGADTTGAKSLTAAQMKLKALYVGFDFDNVWFIDNTADYPYPQLRSLAQEPAEDPTEAPTDAPTDAPTEAPTQTPVIIILGDVDGDLDASVIDASYIQRYNAGFNTPFAIGEPIELG